MIALYVLIAAAIGYGVGRVVATGEHHTEAMDPWCRAMRQAAMSQPFGTDKPSDWDEALNGARS